MKKKSENFENIGNIENMKKMENTEHKEYVNNVFDFSMEFKGKKISSKRFFFGLILFLCLTIWLLWNLYPRDPYIPIYDADRLEVEIIEIMENEYKAISLENITEEFMEFPIFKNDICVFPKKTTINEFQLHLKVGDRIALYYSRYYDMVFRLNDKIEMHESIAFFKL